MPNKHQEHPEDLLLTGETWAVDALFSDANISLKIDGCPAVVWGTHPDNGQFFVGTKSVFNKRVIKICYTEENINNFYAKQDSLAAVLTACLRHLPRVDGVYQGDFIGFGGSDTYTPNTLTYKFSEVIDQDIIIAPHTEYTITGKMCDAVASPISIDMSDTAAVKFVQPFVDRVLVKQSFMDVEDMSFLSEKDAAVAKVAINALIRTGQELTTEVLIDIIGDAQLAITYKMVMNLKQKVLENVIVYNGPACYLGDRKVVGEGLVFSTDRGLFKVVDRAQFSYANFSGGKFS